MLRNYRMPAGILSTSLFLMSGCGQIDRSPQESRNLSLEKSMSQTAWETTKIDSETEVQIQNIDFETPRRIERQTKSVLGASIYDEESLWLAAEMAASKLFPGIRLKRDRLISSKLFTYAEFQQTIQDREIFNAKLRLRMDALGEWMTATSDLIAPHLLDDLHLSTVSEIDLSFLPSEHRVIRHFEVIFPRRNESTEAFEFFHAQEVHVFDPAQQKSYLTWISRVDSEVLAIHYPQSTFEEVQVLGSILPDTPEDQSVLVELPFVQFKIGKERHFADANAFFDIQSFFGKEAVVTLENQFLAVVDNGGLNNALPVEFSRLDSDILNFDSFSTIEERNIYHWVMKARDYMENQLGYHEMKSKMIAIARVGQDLDNAYFDPLLNTLAFGTGKSFLKNTALSKDIVLHEFGHAVTHSIYGLKANYEFSALNEAFSDYFAATLSNDPYIANDAMRNGMPYLRTVKSNYQYKDFFEGNYFHRDGQLFSGALWRLRERLGAELADLMIHEARLENASSILEFWAALRRIDEALDDGNPFTPSPNREAIRKSFQDHGLHSEIRFEAIQKDWTRPWKAKEQAFGCWSQEP